MAEDTRIAAEQKGTCFWGHRWTKWVDDPAPFTLHRATGDAAKDTPIIGMRQIQRRRCVRCNQLEVGSVEIY